MRATITEVPGNEFIIKSKSIEAVPVDAVSRRTLNDAIAVYRKIWNCCVDDLNNNFWFEPSLAYLRDRFVTKKNMDEKDLKRMEWTMRISKRTREQAVIRFLANYDTAKKNFKKRKRKRKTEITMKYKDKNEKQQTIFINKEECKLEDKTTLRLCNGIRLRLKEEVEGEIGCNVIVTRVGYNYYVHVPTRTSPTLVKKPTPDRIVSIDPGVRIFHTYYSPSGEWGEVGIRVDEELDKYYNKLTKVENSNKPKHTKIRATKKIQRKIRNFVDDFQWKLAHWYLKRFRKIIIPRMYVQRSNKQTKQHQADLKHCRFVDRLIHKSMDYEGSEVHVGTEHFTTIACTRCQSLNTMKQSNNVTDDVVKCKACDLQVHRDLNGARNILLKHVKLEVKATTQ